MARIAPSLHSARPRRGSPKLGKLYLALVFLWLRAVDAILMFTAYPRIPLAHKDEFLGAVISTALLTTVLLVCIWFRHSWAKYVLIANLLLPVAGGFALIPCLCDFDNPRFALLAILALMASYFVTALVLICTPDIKRLTSRRFE